MKKLITKEQALEALDNMDDYARMADIDPIGPRRVLEQFIEENCEHGLKFNLYNLFYWAVATGVLLFLIYTFL